jgi:hypothetical protein
VADVTAFSSHAGLQLSREKADSSAAAQREGHGKGWRIGTGLPKLCTRCGEVIGSERGFSGYCSDQCKADAHESRISVRAQGNAWAFARGELYGALGEPFVSLRLEIVLGSNVMPPLCPWCLMPVEPGAV